MLENETLRTIKQRRSVRSFKEEQISDDALQAILDAGTCAPNAGDQSWHFTAIQNKDILSRLDLAAKKAAISMNISGLLDLATDEQFHCFYNAPTLVIVSVDEQFPIPLDADCAAAIENMLLAAESLGLGSCWVYFVTLAFISDQGAELHELLQIPAGYKPCYAAALGYRKIAVPIAPQHKPDRITIIK